jgi:ferric-dicitrate binding protein FerR (iron transport regulator)
MNVTKDVINDLYPLYLEKECSADTRALVEEYLQRNPQHAEELRRVMSAPLPKIVAPATGLEEMDSLRKARRRVRRRSWLMALAIFFSLAPLSFFSADGRTWWLLRDAPGSALVYAALGVVFWIIYAVERRRSNSL